MFFNNNDFKLIKELYLNSNINDLILLLLDRTKNYIINYNRKTSLNNDDYYYKEQLNYSLRLLGSLSEKEFLIFMLYVGYPFLKLKFNEIGLILNHTESYIARIYNKILLKINNIDLMNNYRHNRKSEVIRFNYYKISSFVLNAVSEILELYNNIKKKKYTINTLIN